MRTNSSLELARFACDFCRQKKLKCSRELPKCSSCKPWPGSCEYSRDKLSPVQPSSDCIPEPGSGNIEDRLHQLEQTVQHLTNSVDRVLQKILPDSQKNSNSSRVPSFHQGHAAEHISSDSELYIGPSHSFSFLKEAPANIEAIFQPRSNATLQNAYSDINYISNSLKTAHVSQKVGGDGMAYYVPSKAAGYRMISQFLENSELGEPFFQAPPDDVIRLVVFEPQKVRDKAWIIYFNYLLLSIVSAGNDESNEKDKLRHNVQLALNDSSIFLVPSMANIQALTLLATHGEDYASPNLSWMLLGHACRQAEALGLHFPSHRLSETDQQRRLSLFWLLSVMDKSCSLAFGRPAFLPTVSYQNVPLPDYEFLMKFQPHNRTFFTKQKTCSRASNFGPQLLSRSFALTRLMDCIQSLLATGESPLTKEEIRSQLHNWALETDHVLTEIINNESSSCSAEQLREMSLGINGFKFQYLHALVLLLKGDESFSSVCLSSSREAIFLLTGMVSNWGSVYNGVVWQLLYFPFTPFFVIFENIVHFRGGPLTPEIEQDLDLLARTVTYFAEMRSQMILLATVCFRLQHAAAVFLQLAQAHVSRYASAGSTERSSSVDSTQQFMNTPQNDRPDGSATSTWGHQARDNIINGYSQAHEALTTVDVGDMDISSYLEWLPSNMDDSTWPVFDAARSNPTKGNPPTKSAQNRRQTFDSVFDWFSWDSYYAGNST